MGLYETDCPSTSSPPPPSPNTISNSNNEENVRDNCRVRSFGADPVVSSDATAMAPALNEPLTQVQLSLSPAAASASPRPGILANNHHHHHHNDSNNAKLASPHYQNHHHPHNNNNLAQFATPSAANGSSGGGYVKATPPPPPPPSFQLAFIQQITNANGPAPSTGLSQASRHMDRKQSSQYSTPDQQQQQCINNSSSFSTTPPTTNTTNTGSTLLSNNNDPPPDSDDPNGGSSLLDDAELLDESTNALINHALQTTPTSSNHQVLSLDFPADHHHQLNHLHHHLDHHSDLDSSSPHNNNTTMGMQKDYLKDNPDMEQMLGDLANSSDIDLLQVFKSLAPPGGTDNLCDLASGLALFNDVDVMGISLDDVSTPLKEPDTQDIRAEIKKRQTQMMRKCDFLMRRLRKLQAGAMGDHVDEEVSGLFDYTQKLLKRKERESKSISTMQPVAQLQAEQQLAAADGTKTLLGRLDAVANAQQVVLQKLTRKHSDGGGTPASSSLASSSAVVGSGGRVITLPVNRLVPMFDKTFSSQVELTAGNLHTQLKIVSEAIDSDATASSSGGDSGDEFSAYTKQQQAQQQLPTPELQTIAKRAATRWARDRASIAARWSWLLAQIADLEHRIRQHTELHNQFRKDKGAVTFEDYYSCPPASGGASGSSSSSASDIVVVADSNNSNSSLSVNGYRGVLPGNTVAAAKQQLTSDIDGTTTTAAFQTTNNSNNTNQHNNGAFDATAGSSRTRAFKRTEFRKRKLLQTTNLHTISKKAAKPSTVKCGCQWPLFPCALCTGRADPTAPRDLPDMLAPAERVGLLDAGFHPVISLPNDTNQGIYIEAVLRQTDFQNKAVRASSKAAIRGALAIQKALKKDERMNRKQAAAAGTTRKKYNMSASKLRKNARKNNTSQSGTPTRGGHLNNTPASSKHRRSHGGGGDMSASSQLHSENFEYGPNGAMLPRSKNASPTPASSGGVVGRRARSSYDIDNIVIPYSVAASTRVEILKCKEIPTPKWREINENSEKADSSTLSPELHSSNPEPNPSPVVAAASPSSVVDDPQQPADSPTTPASKSNADAITLMKSPAAKKVPNATITPQPMEEDVNDDDEDIEKITPDEIMRRHQHALNEERKKFSTYLKFPWSTRSRANRRIDSRADSSGTNTPDPTSPAAKAPNVGADHESISSAPSTPHPPTTYASGTPLEQINENPTTTSDTAKPDPVTANPSTSGRRRTVSAKRNSGGEPDNHHHPIIPFVQPFDEREFPLSGDLFEAMLLMMPDAHQDICDSFLLHDADDQHGGASTSQTTGSANATPGVDHSDPAIMAAMASGGSSYKSAYDFDSYGGGAGSSGLSFVGGGMSAGGGGSHMLRDTDEETESIESGLIDEDPNDPEWCEPPSRL